MTLNIPKLTRLLIAFSLVNGETQRCNNLLCLRWTITEKEFQLSCRIPDLIFSVYILDPFDHLQAYCQPKELNKLCYSNSTAATTYFNTNEVIFFVTGMEKRSLEGLWKCRHGNNITETRVSLSRDILDTTDVNLCGTVLKLDNKYILNMLCYSCWNPVGNASEFLVNNKTIDNIRFHNNMCYHKNGKCSADTCNCSSDGRAFSWLYKVDSVTDTPTFSCEMRFSDDSMKISFRKVAVIFFNGSDLIGGDSQTVITSRPDQYTPKEGMSKLIAVVFSVIVSVAIVLVSVIIGLRFKVMLQTGTTTINRVNCDNDNDELSERLETTF